MDDDNSALIATLVVEKGNYFGEAFFSAEHNRDRYLPPDGSEDISHSPATTASFGIEGEIAGNENNTHRIVLSFSRPPRDPAVGFVFGSGPECDIRLSHVGTCLTSIDRREYRAVSQKHFAVTFDDSGRVEVKDFSTNGLAVTYGKNAHLEVRRHFQWIIFEEIEDVVVTVPLFSENVKFQIKLAKHSLNEDYDRYQAQVADFQRARLQSTALTMKMLELDVRRSTTTAVASGNATPHRQRAVYVRRELLGQGGFGIVHRVLDASTGTSFAAKTFLSDSEDFQCSARREINIMRSLAHEHLIGFKGIEERPLTLIMQFAAHGSLRSRHRQSKLSMDECIFILKQCLEGVNYLHGLGYAHRDIKPDNILVTEIDPIRVKLGDFGLSKQDVSSQEGLNTRCGTSLYMAPEVYWGQSGYKVGVDIWSLGVVALQYSHGLPPFEESSSYKSWVSELTGAARALPETNCLAKLISTGMLLETPSQRKTASECLEMAASVECNLTAPIISTPSQVLPSIKTESNGSGASAMRSSDLSLVHAGPSVRPSSPMQETPSVRIPTPVADIPTVLIHPPPPNVPPIQQDVRRFSKRARNPTSSGISSSSGREQVAKRRR